MEPQQQQPGQLGHNPYDFILNPPKPTTPHPLGGLPIPKIGGSSLGLQIFILLAGAGLVMVIIAIITSALTSNNLNKADLTNLAAQQIEIIRVSALGGGTVTQSSNQQLAINVQLTLKTDSRNLLTFLSTSGITVSSKQLTAGNNAQTTLELQNAQANSTTDDVFAQIMKSELESYANNLRKDYGEAKSKTLKSLLNADYIQAQFLLKEVPPTSSVQS